jgi:hypothetical protein
VRIKILCQLNPERAVWLLGYAESLRAEVWEPLSADDRIEYEETITQARSSLTADVWEAAWSAGHRASLMEVLSRIPADDPR